MKKLYFLFLVLFTHLAYAQVPQGIPYQAAARNASGQALVNTVVKVRFSILDSVATGTVVYKETHSTTTNSVGLFNVNVGMGTPVTATFSSINWGKNAKFMQMELDITGTGSSYVDMGTQQMLSVPYALYSTYASNATSVSGNKYTPGTKVGFSSNTTWTCPAGVTQITVEVWGGGGGGGSSSGCVYRWNGTKAYVFRVGGYITGVKGGNGGKGGYNKTTLNVIPGNVYTIQVGAAGAGGIGGCGVAVNAGTNGQTGGTTSFLLNGTNLLQASGGTGGLAGTVSNTCPSQSGTVGITCSGSVPGTNGSDAMVSNYANPLSSVISTSYIPSNYLTPSPSCCANYGLGAPANSSISNDTGCQVVANGDNNYPLYEYSPIPGANGEQGFCVISY